MRPARVTPPVKCGRRRAALGKSKSKAPSKKRKKKLQKPRAGRATFAVRKGPHGGTLGDLRLVRQHIDAYRAGEPAALDVLMSLGRDAAYPALEYAEALQDPELIELARRLVAVPPAHVTNLYDLRAAAVEAVVERGKEAPSLFSAEPVVRGGGLALFDPREVSGALVRSGRPRREVEPQERGAIAVFGMSLLGDVQVRVVAGSPEEGKETLRRRLRVTSGVVAVGAPEAADGPRLGTVRLDPERTGLDHALAAGRVELFRLPPGLYRVDATHPPSGGVLLFVHPETEPEGSLVLDSGAVPGGL